MAVAAAVAGPSTLALQEKVTHLECPFCQYQVSAADEYILLLHIESQHTDDSPFIPRDDATSAPLNPFEYLDDDNDPESCYVCCPEDGCEELILLLELQNHMDFHTAEHFSMEAEVASSTIAVVGTGGNRAKERRRPHSESGSSAERERPARKRREGKGRSERGDGESRENRENRHHGREGKVKFIEAPPPPEAKRSWLEKAAMAIVPHVGTSSAEPKQPLKAITYPAQREHREHRERRSRSGVKKLGKSDLGPYAHEAQMPDWLRAQLAQGGRAVTIRKIDPSTGRLMNVVQIANETPDLIPTIAQLSERDPAVARAWVCHPGVKHVGKQIAKEGGFCGYRNIQMIVSYIQAAYPRTAHPFGGRIPTILALQDTIEAGWDAGINASARAETGGVRGTRKYIGTSEAQTVLLASGIANRARAFNRSDGLHTQLDLLRFVEAYFSAPSAAAAADANAPPAKVTRTAKAPIYFQHSGHSMTIVGVEKMVDGMSNLLVFDPFFTPSETMRSLAGRRNLPSRVNPAMMLKVYRRGLAGYLQKYREFELIILDEPRT
ncbi:peptidase family C78-domain-containing protein [Geopyxis carbonaria]|nr:peptidase family C78-domain-containing protein [Geopyxis carbonaria]